MLLSARKVASVFLNRCTVICFSNFALFPSVCKASCIEAFDILRPYLLINNAGLLSVRVFKYFFNTRSTFLGKKSVLQLSVFWAYTVTSPVLKLISLIFHRQHSETRTPVACRIYTIAFFLGSFWATRFNARISSSNNISFFLSLLLIGRIRSNGFFVIISLIKKKPREKTLGIFTGIIERIRANIIPQFQIS